MFHSDSPNVSLTPPLPLLTRFSWISIYINIAGNLFKNTFSTVVISFSYLPLDIIFFSQTHSSAPSVTFWLLTASSSLPHFCAANVHNAELCSLLPAFYLFIIWCSRCVNCLPLQTNDEKIMLGPQFSSARADIICAEATASKRETVMLSILFRSRYPPLYALRFVHCRDISFQLAYFSILAPASGMCYAVLSENFA